jgi:hypothetical protein
VWNSGWSAVAAIQSHPLLGYSSRRDNLDLKPTMPRKDTPPDLDGYNVYGLQAAHGIVTK